MTALSWDTTGTRYFETGVDRAVLYLPDGKAVAWNGFVSISEKVVGAEQSPVYFDGVKYGDAISAGDFAATIKAITYPDEFLDVEGVVFIDNGLHITNQEPKRFGLSYRTKIGNDVEGADLGYKLHVLYNLIATPSQKTYDTFGGANVTMFEWNVTAVPNVVAGYRASSHLIFDSREMGALVLKDIEDTLYGYEGVDARLPEMTSLISFVDNWVIIRVTDNYDGTFTISGPDELVYMLDSTTFEVIQANSTYTDANTYIISDTTY